MLACENSRPSSLLARVAFRETPEEGQLFPQATMMPAKLKLHVFYLQLMSLHNYMWQVYSRHLRSLFHHS